MRWLTRTRKHLLDRLQAAAAFTRPYMHHALCRTLATSSSRRCLLHFDTKQDHAAAGHKARAQGAPPAAPYKTTAAQPGALPLACGSPDTARGMALLRSVPTVATLLDGKAQTVLFQVRLRQPGGGGLGGRPWMVVGQEQSAHGRGSQSLTAERRQRCFSSCGCWWACWGGGWLARGVAYMGYSWGWKPATRCWQAGRTVRGCSYQVSLTTTTAWVLSMSMCLSSRNPCVLHLFSCAERGIRCVLG